MRMGWGWVVAIGGALGCGVVGDPNGGVPFGPAPGYPDDSEGTTDGGEEYDLESTTDPFPSSTSTSSTTSTSTSSTTSTTDTSTTSETSTETSTTNGDSSTSTTTDASSSTETGDPPIDVDGIEYTLTVDSAWPSGECDTVSLENVSNDAITWAIQLEVQGTVNQAWNATATQVGTTATFVGVVHNATLDPGETTEFGFCLAF